MVVTRRLIISSAHTREIMRSHDSTPHGTNNDHTIMYKQVLMPSKEDSGVKKKNPGGSREKKKSLTDIQLM
jgi:hypothetical protein